LKGEQPDKKRVAEFEKKMKTTLGLIENVWLKDTPYLTGDNVTIADLLGVCEVEQPSEFFNFFHCICVCVCVCARACARVL
jgi:glutathione S-transferase